MGSQNKGKRIGLEKAIKRQKGQCHLCGEQMTLSKDTTDPRRATADHIIPKSYGGSIKGNIAAAHSICNEERGNMPIDEFKKLKEQTTNE